MTALRKRGGAASTTPRGGGRRGVAYNIGPSSLSSVAALQRGVSTPDSL